MTMLDPSHAIPRKIIRLSSEQETAIALCTDRAQRIVGITGGAGTGKTTILKQVFEELESYNAGDVVLVAPTGRAAKRISEATGLPARTIHRLLEFPQPLDLKAADEEGKKLDPNYPVRNRSNPIDQRFVLVDEASMVGPTLYNQLLEALPARACVRFFGDNNQLAPVEPGLAPFKTVLEKYPSVELTFNYRSGDALISNALRILQSRMPVRNEQFEIIWTEDPLKTLYAFVGDARAAFSGLDHQIIIPTRKGKLGTNVANPSIQIRLNPSGPSLRLPRVDEKDGDLLVRANDKFLWIKNDYQLAMFNGEIGNVIDVDPEGGSLDLTTPDRASIPVPAHSLVYNQFLRRPVRYDPRKQIDLGYAITTHKAQGSEFNTVVYCIAAGHAWLLNRRNFYTAVTRARTRVVLICSRQAMRYSLGPEKQRSA